MLLIYNGFSLTEPLRTRRSASRNFHPALLRHAVMWVSLCMPAGFRIIWGVELPPVQVMVPSSPVKSLLPTGSAIA